MKILSVQKEKGSYRSVERVTGDYSERIFCLRARDPICVTISSQGFLGGDFCLPGSVQVTALVSGHTVCRHMAGCVTSGSHVSPFPT